MIPNVTLSEALNTTSQKICVFRQMSTITPEMVRGSPVTDRAGLEGRTFSGGSPYVRSYRLIDSHQNRHVISRVGNMYFQG